MSTTAEKEVLPENEAAAKVPETEAQTNGESDMPKDFSLERLLSSFEGKELNFQTPLLFNTAGSQIWA